MFTYEHKVQYYETDQMGIVHHSNYIRWFESARIEFLNALGISYAAMEEHGIISPVLHVECDYKDMVRFGDTVVITADIVKYNGVKLDLTYTVTDKSTGKLRTTGLSKHCFLHKDGKPMSLKRELPELDQLLMIDMEQV
ncbi:thioesterase family protein [Butyrivibrio sp. INlla16]|uniref:acyl-CoA thioesterase n=1 Tax=Butyrivibrio sp. INlla16 TaxID=1520807 RepID=UPI00088BD117|nr:thioesterase family protein [Butyrivibrio sp. INlla16]SDB50229.1 acyl-CoA thioester hydrolase [Butyrivibrio sp. INlla16]